ncbi:MAG: gliding motility-associated C-terminal domain-containing protein [Chitinophagales bacterium]|nr:gliding motility-associated C-terminal domain-containing protein [Bacteroidota bacterium]MCB9043117.1 gliding motility-associated C-terminal domain-containing protein [Chitinophagales bacterium]
MKLYTISLFRFFYVCLAILGSSFASVYAQYVAPPSLQCVNDAPNSEVLINWTNNHSCGGGFVSTNLYYATDPNGPYTEVNISDINADEYTLNSIASNVYVYLETECAWNSSALSDTLSNLELDFPEIIRVEAFDGQARIEWIPVTGNGAFGYIIYQAGPTPIDTVYGSNTSFYLHTTATPNLGVESYTISTIDSCLNSGTYNPDFHSTIFLTAEYDTCRNEVDMQWTPYQGWEVNDYIIYKIRPSDGSNIAIDTVPASQQYYTASVQAYDDYRCFNVKAVGSELNQTSNSSLACFVFEQPELPSYIYMQNASVNTNGEVIIEWYNETGVQPSKLMVFRGTDPAELSRLVGLGSFPLTFSIQYLDDKANTQRDSYYYQIIAENVCGAQQMSNVVRTVNLQASDNVNLTNSLLWNAFELDNATVSGYTIYRGLNETDMFTLANVDAATFSYIDDISEVPLQQGEKYCYRIEAHFDLVISDIGVNESLSSWSNVYCLGQNSRIFVPNVFNPNGVNNIFKPVIQFPNAETYTMIVLNRWGEKVFVTQNPDEGWDGFVNRQMAPQGVYSYVIQMESLNGNSIEKKGTVLLLR